MIDTGHLRNRYSSLDDAELLRLVETDLLPEARELLHSELIERGLRSPASAAASLCEPPDPGPTTRSTPQQKAPRWSRLLQSYAFFFPIAVLPVFGVKGVIWIGIACITGYVAALKVAIGVRSRTVAPDSSAVVGNFIATHLIVLAAYTWLLRAVFA